jgi:hypothetical protein
MMLKIILCQRFGESISNLILGIDREDLDESLSHMFKKTLKSCSLISCSSPMLGMMSRRACDIAMYSASVVDKATWDCSLEAQETGHLAQKMIQPFRDLEVLGSTGANALVHSPEKSASQ